MCRVISCVIGKGCLPTGWPTGSLDKTLLAFALLHFVLQSQTCLLFQISLDFLLLHSKPLQWKGHLFFGVSSIKVKVKSLNHVWLFATPWTVACQAPPSLGFSRQEYRCGLPCPPPGNLPDPEIEPASPVAPALQGKSLLLSHWGSMQYRIGITNNCI